VVGPPHGGFGGGDGVIRFDEAGQFLQSLFDPETGGYRYVQGQPASLYGTAFALLGKRYVGQQESLDPRVQEFVLNCQVPETGWFVGPELREWQPGPGAHHDAEHVLFHHNVHVQPLLQEFGLESRYPFKDARQFLDIPHLEAWLDARDLSNAWLEGNSLLFVGQFLLWLRDVEKVPGAGEALIFWFEWLDKRIDPASGLWGTDRGSSLEGAVYGGYHQLLLYYSENHPLTSPERIVDGVLSLQHPDGGFSPHGCAGACEDVDSVDILVNLYKLYDYRRPAIRAALRRCLRTLAAQQNPDGGWPYRPNAPWVHLGVPATKAEPNVSHAFGTWFRIHTLALIAELLPDEPELGGRTFRFNQFPSMGWHRTWDRSSHRPPATDVIPETLDNLRMGLNAGGRTLHRYARGAKRRLRALVKPDRT